MYQFWSSVYCLVTTGWNIVIRVTCIVHRLSYFPILPDINAQHRNGRFTDDVPR